MFEHLSALREPLFAARLLREEVLLAPLAPDAAERFRAWCRARNGRSPASGPALALAVEMARDDGLTTVRREHLSRLAEACGGGAGGGGALRSGPGDAFQGTPAPPGAGPGRAALGGEGLAGLLEELLETVNSPLAVEVWPPPARAFALHFLLRLVQPFAAPAEAVAHAAEALLLAADGFEGDRVLLPPPVAGGDERARRPDPDAFASARAHRLVEALAETREVQRERTARQVLLGWLDRREAGLGTRQERLLRWLAEGERGRALRFDDYVGLHAGRRAPSLRSLQRDWKGLRDQGFLVVHEGDRFALSTAPLRYDARS